MVATARAPAKAAELQQLAAESGGRLSITPLDVSDAASIEVRSAKRCQPTGVRAIQHCKLQLRNLLSCMHLYLLQKWAEGLTSSIDHFE